MTTQSKSTARTSSALTGIAVDVVVRETPSGKRLQLMKVLSNEDGVRRRYDVSAFDAPVVQHGQVVNDPHSGVTEQPWEKDGKSGVNLRVVTNGRGLVVLNKNNVLEPKAA